MPKPRRCSGGPCARSPRSRPGRWGVGTRRRSGPGGSPTACAGRRGPVGPVSDPAPPSARARPASTGGSPKERAMPPAPASGQRSGDRGGRRVGPRTTGFPSIGHRGGTRSGNSDRSERSAPRPFHRRRVGRRSVRSAEGDHSGGALRAPTCPVATSRRPSPPSRSPAPHPPRPTCGERAPQRAPRLTGGPPWRSFARQALRCLSPGSRPLGWKMS